MSNQLHSIILSWKPYKIQMQDLHAWLSLNLAEYNGMIADDQSLVICTNRAASLDEKLKVEQHWNEMIESVEAAKIALFHRRESIAGIVRQTLPYVNVTEMIPAEKKLLMNLDLSTEDKDALLAKYPQA